MMMIEPDVEVVDRIGELLQELETKDKENERLTADGLEIGRKLLSVMLEKVAIENERDGLLERIAELEGDIKFYERHVDIRPPAIKGDET